MKNKGKIVKKNSQTNSAMHFFMYMVSFLSLAIFATGIGNIIFQIINKSISDDIGYAYAGQFSQSAVKYGIATLLIAMPVYFIVMYFINKKIFQGEIKNNSMIRKWLIYIVLFITAAVIIGDLISLVFSLLDGDLTTKFLLKALTVLVIAGSIFGYYVWDIRKDKRKGNRYLVNRIFFTGGIIISVIILVASFFIVDSPQVARDKKVDQETIRSLKHLTSQIRFYYEKNKKLPNKIEDMENINRALKNNFKKIDGIEYSKLGELSYEICAYFRRDMSEKDSNRIYYLGNFEENWDYSQGKNCFSKKIMKQNQDNKTIRPLEKPIPIVE
jgi:hypothetical protein